MGECAVSGFLVQKRKTMKKPNLGLPETAG